MIVDADPTVVEADLLGGRLACPICQGELGPWGHACARPLRLLGGEERELRPRRSRCREPDCRKTFVLLPDTSLVRRRDEVAVIGRALTEKAGGATRAAIAAGLGRDEGTIRGWFRSFRRNAEAIRALFTRLARAFDPLVGPIEPTGSPFRDALAAIGVAVRAAALRFGPGPQWSLVSVLSAGELLSNTKLPSTSAL